MRPSTSLKLPASNEGGVDCGTDSVRRSSLLGHQIQLRVSAKPARVKSHKSVVCWAKRGGQNVAGKTVSSTLWTSAAASLSPFLRLRRGRFTRRCFGRMEQRANTAKYRPVSCWVTRHRLVTWSHHLIVLVTLM